jgi:periplasmic divalent cation tolerance protein
MKNKMIMIYITASNIEEARKIGKHLLEKRLVGCVNMFPVSAMYWWEGKIESEEECVLIAKTFENKFEAVKKEVEAVHSYSVSFIAKISADVNRKYFEWSKGEIK